jgi:hypothetical protein
MKHGGRESTGREVAQDYAEFQEVGRACELGGGGGWGVGGDFLSQTKFNLKIFN